MSGVDKNPAQCRLRRANMFEEALSEPCANESLSLAKEGVVNNTLIFLEDGVILSKVPAAVFLPVPLVICSICSFSCSTRTRVDGAACDCCGIERVLNCCVISRSLCIARREWCAFASWCGCRSVARLPFPTSPPMYCPDCQRSMLLPAQEPAQVRWSLHFLPFVPDPAWHSVSASRGCSMPVSSSCSCCLSLCMTGADGCNV